MIVLERIPREDVEKLWQFVLPLIRSACDAVTTELTPDFIREEALADRRTLWVIFDTDDPFGPFLATWVTGQRQTNKGQVLFIEACGGRDMHRWLPDCLDELEAQAKAIGIHRIEIEGRRGWKRVLPGYREARIVLTKDL
jgi:hypothetical protein